MKKVPIIVLSCFAIIFGALIYIFWWPIPSCPENDFDNSIHVTSDLLDIRYKEVVKYPYPIFEKKLEVPGVLGTRLRLHYKFFPSTRMKTGIGPIDPKLCLYDLESTNSQVRVSALLSNQKVVWVKVNSYGTNDYGDAVCGILKSRVPTKQLPITTVTSKSPLWDKEKK